jgi:hypothetical protein
MMHASTSPMKIASRTLEMDSRTSLRLIVERARDELQREASAELCNLQRRPRSATATVLLEGWRAMLISTAGVPFAVTVV